MKDLLNIVFYSIKENFRTKIYLVILLFSVVLVFIGFLLMGLSGFEQPQRILVNTGVATIEVFCLVLILLNSIGLFLQEVENKTIYLILSKPISRTKYIIGKYIGLLIVAFLSIFLMCFIHLIFIKIAKWYVTKEYFLTIFTIFLKIGMIASVAIFFALVMTSQVASVIVSLLLWIVGHFSSEFIFIVEKIKIKGIQIFLKIMYYIFPNFQYYNIKDYLDSVDFVSKFSLTKGLIYWIIYNIICISLACILFRKKDL